MAGALPTADHPFWWHDKEIDKLRRGGDGHIMVWRGVSFWRSLTRLDLIDVRLDLYP
jgi:hypothetical protein